MANQKDYVRDIEKKDNLASNLKSLEWIDKFDFKHFDAEVEKSFQDFLEDKKNQFTTATTKEVLEPVFNGWLDKEFGALDSFKEKEIAKQIIVPTTFELQNFKTLVELEIFQTQVINAKMETEKQVNLDLIGVGDLTLKLYRWLDQRKNEVIEELNKNFKDRDTVIWFIKEWNVESIRRLQCMLVGLNYEKGKLQTNDFMKNPWTDGLFWTETFDALKNYINNNPVSEGAGDQNSSVENATTTTASFWSADIVGTSIGKTPNVGTGNSGVNNIDATKSWLDTWVEIDKKDMVFECKMDEKVDLASVPNGTTFEVIPPYSFDDAKNIPVTLLDGKLQYEWKFTGQDNFTIVVKDGGWKEIYRKNMTVNVEEDEIWKVDINKYESLLTKAEKEIKDIEKNGNKKEDIEKRIREIKTEYKDNLKKIEDLKEKNGEKEEVQKLSDRNSEIEAITKALVLKEAEIHMKEYLNNSWEILEIKLNENCDYYFGGEYISQKEFMKRLGSERKKIDLSRTRFVNFDVELDNYDSIDKYLIDEKSDKRNFTIKDLILTDDKNFGKGIKVAKNQEIQYKAERYFWSWSEKIKNVQREKRALKRILWIKGLFGRGWTHDDLSISTLDYNTNNPALLERRNLRKLKKILLNTYKNKDVSIQNMFYDVSRDYDLAIPPRPSQDKDKNKQELFGLYKMYREDQNCGDYYKKVMWLLENYFLRWIDGFHVIDEENNKVLFKNLYEREAIWRADGLIDPDKRRLAVNHLFKKSTRKWSVELMNASFADSKELKELKRMVNKIDLSTYLTDPNASKKHEKFTKLYDKYKKSKQGDVKDGNGNFVVMWEKDTSDSKECYYNAVFDFLAWVVEWRQDIVSAINSMKIIDNLADIGYDEDKEKHRYENETEKKFVMLLGDYNRDGRVDFGDRWYVMWFTVKNVYKSVNVDRKFSSDKDKIKAPWENLMDFCEILMEQNGDLALLSDVKKLKEEGWEDGWLKEILGEFENNPWLLGYFQTTLANSPMPIDYIFRYGKTAQEEYIDYVLPQVENGTFKVEGLDNAFADQYKKLLEQWLVDDPEIRAVLKPIFYAGVLQNWGISTSVWTWLTYDAGKAGQFTMSLGVWNVAKDKDPVLGIVFSYNNSAKIWKNTRFNFGTWIWATNKSLFLPMAYGTIWITSRLNPGVDLNSLKAKSAHYFSTWWNLTWIPEVWFGGGWYLWRSRNKMELTDEQSVEIKNTLTGTNGVLYKSLAWVDLTKDKENIISGIKQNLAKQFYNKSLNDLKDNEHKLISKVAENLYKWISYYGAWLSLKENDPKLTAIVHEVAEAYAIQWKNDTKLDATKWHLSGAGISIQILARYIPVISLVEFSKYKNLYSKETKQSHANYYEKLVTGRWMNEMEGENFSLDWYITENGVNYLNAKLGIAHPDVLTPDLDIKLEPMTENADGRAVNVLYIPLDLIKYANINVDSKVVNYTKIVDNKYLLVPANAKIWLMDYSRLNSARFHLFIWDNKAKLDDIQVGYDMEDYQWDPTKYEWNVEAKIIVEKEYVNNQIIKLKNDVREQWYVEYTLPIKECFEVENWKAIFELEEGIWKQCVNVGGNNSLITIEWDSLIMPQTGTLTMIRQSNDKYYFYYKSNPAEDLVLDYQLGAELTAGTPDSNATSIEMIDGMSWKRETKSFANIDIFLESNEIDRLFDGIEKGLSRMDNNVPSIYWQFMAESFTTLEKTVIEEENYEKAFGSLQEILKNKKNNFSDPIYDNLRTKIEGTVTSEEKIMIVDGFKSIFAYHTMLSEGWVKTHNWQQLTYFFTKRGTHYKELYWYNKNIRFPLENTYRDSLFNDFRSQKTLERRKEKNLFGMTAFYHQNNKEWRWYSMTQMWATNVLWIKNSPNSWIKRIEDKDLSATQEWFWGNLDKTIPHKEILKKTLQKQINIDGLELTDDNLKNLLLWKSIDILDQKVRIKLDLEYVFYLLWECANESIGINLEWIEVSIKIEDGKLESGGVDGKTDLENINENWHRRVVVKGNKHYGSNLNTSGAIANTEDAYATKQTFGVVTSYTKLWEPGDDPWSDPEDPVEPGDDPWSDPNSP